MEKSSDAFRTISEVADDLRLPQHVLRFWETRFAHIKPLKRAGGRRYYRPSDVVLLKTIRQLLYDEGYTIKGVQRLLKEQGVRNLRNGAHPSSESVADETALPEASSPELDLDDLPERPPVFEPPPNIVAPTAAAQPALKGEDRDALFEALAAIEDCTRILAAVRASGA